MTNSEAEGQSAAEWGPQQAKDMGAQKPRTLQGKEMSRRQPNAHRARSRPEGTLAGTLKSKARLDKSSLFTTVQLRGEAVAVILCVTVMCQTTSHTSSLHCEVLLLLMLT